MRFGAFGVAVTFCFRHLALGFWRPTDAVHPMLHGHSQGLPQQTPADALQHSVPIQRHTLSLILEQLTLPDGGLFIVLAARWGSGQRAIVQKTRRPQFLQPRQIARRFQTEMI